MAVWAALEATAARIPDLDAALPAVQAPQWVAAALLDSERVGGGDAGGAREALSDIAGAYGHAVRQQPFGPGVPGGSPLPVAEAHWLPEGTVSDELSSTGPTATAARERRYDANVGTAESAGVPRKRPRGRAQGEDGSRKRPRASESSSSGSPAPAGPGAGQGPVRERTRAERDREWLLSAALSDNVIAEMLEVAQAVALPAGATASSLRRAIDDLGAGMGLHGTTGEVRDELKALQRAGRLHDPGTYQARRPRSGPPPETVEMPAGWLLSAALSNDDLPTIAVRGRACGHYPYKSLLPLRTAIEKLAATMGVHGSAAEVRDKLKELERAGRLHGPGTNQAAGVAPSSEWLLSAALSSDTVSAIAANGKACGARPHDGVDGVRNAIVRLGADMGVYGTAGQVRRQLKALRRQGRLQDPDTYQRGRFADL
ncbi:hypothetical protein ACFQ78_39375 [Streptomyces sp. NPDC056519]|uniref:hypothetical protein n=1 Tax=Streptomyces sp. NPDC056519 TaxID=3345849 RepID=UPI00367F6A79